MAKHRLPETFAEALTAARTQLRLSKIAIGRHVGVTGKTVSRWEDGRFMPGYRGSRPRRARSSDGAGHVIAAVATLRDITEQRAAAAQLRDLSSTDELTGLVDRRGFLANANARVATLRARRRRLRCSSDVNGLERINDELGHEQGDQEIQDAAAVFRTVFRDEDVLALGGDEFVALLPNFSHAARDPLLERLAAELRAHVEREPRPFWLSGITFMT